MPRTQTKRMGTVLLKLLAAVVLVTSMIPTTVFADIDEQEQTPAAESSTVTFTDTMVTVNEAVIVNAGDVVEGTISFNITPDTDGAAASNLTVTVSVEGNGVTIAEKGNSFGFIGAADNQSMTFTTIEYSETTFSSTFEITIPETLSGVSSVTVSVAVSADNASSTGSDSATFLLNTPAISVSTSTSDTPISAESDVTVTTVLTETDANSTAYGSKIVITDDGGDYGVTTFQDVTVTRQDGSEVGATTNTSGDTLTVTLNSGETVTADSPVVITYVDSLAAGYEYNGSTVSITATASASNVDDATSSTSYKINEPNLSVEQSVVMPVIEATDTVQGATSEADGDASDGDGIVSSDTDSEETVAVDTGQLPTTEDDATESEAELVINPGETADFSITMKQTNADAIARDVALSVVLDEVAAAAGVYIDIDSVAVADSNGNDITSAFTIVGDETSTSFTVTGAEAAYLDWRGEQTYVVTYTVVAGESTNADLRGLEFTTTASLTASNVSEDGYVEDYSVVAIASSVISIEKTVSAIEIYPGDIVDYIITVTNTSEMEESTAMNIVVTDILSQNAYDIGYRIDESTIVVYDANGNDITEGIEIVWNSDTSFTVYTYASLDDNQSLSIEYQAVTDDIAAETYSTNVFNTAVASADNATYQVAVASGSYIGIDRVETELLMGGSVADETILAQTGDTVLYVVSGVAAAAIIAGAGVLIWRRFRGGNR